MSIKALLRIKLPCMHKWGEWKDGPEKEAHGFQKYRECKKCGKRQFYQFIC